MAALANPRRTPLRLHYRSSPGAADLDHDGRGARSILKMAKERSVMLCETDAGGLATMAGPGNPHQGYILETMPFAAPPPPVSLLRSSDGHKTVSMAIDMVQDPRNLGALIRSAYFFGVDSILVNDKNCAPLGPVASRASAGSLDLHQGIYSTSNMVKLIKSAREHGFAVVAPVADDGHHPRQSAPLTLSEFMQRPRQPVMLVVGNEGSGLRRGLLPWITHRVTIPAGRGLAPGFDSLNVSVAMGILLQRLTEERLFNE